MLILNDVTAPTSGVRLVQDQVVAYLNERPIAGEGTLHVSESVVTWVSRAGGKGFSLSYPSIVIHAISTDISTFPHECLLVIVDAGKTGRRDRRPVSLLTAEEAAAARDVQLAEEELKTGEGEEDEEESEDPQLTLRFVPTDTSALQRIYDEMAACQELNPEEEDMESEEEDEEEEGAVPFHGELGEGWYTANDNLDDIELSAEGRANLERMTGQRNANGNGGHDGDEEGMEE